MLDILFIAFTVVFCIDNSGAMEHLNKLVFKKLYPGVKYNYWSIPLLGCSLCSTFWASILYVIITGQFSFGMLAYIALISAITPNISDFICLIRDVLIKLINIPYDLWKL